MVTISDEARDYLRKHGGAVHLFVTWAGLIWGRVNFGPSVRRGVPKNVTEYDMAVVNRVRLYLPKHFDTPFSLTINVCSLFGIKILYVSGWKPV